MKSWWDDTLRILYEEMKRSYLIHKQADFSENTKKPFQKAKSLLRKQKKFNIRLKQTRQLSIMNSLLKTGQSTEFWRKLKKFNRNDQSVDIPIADLKAEYEKHLSDKFPTNPNAEKEANEKVKNFLKDTTIKDAEVKITIK